MQIFRQFFAEFIGNPANSSKLTEAIGKVSNNKGFEITTVLNFVYSIVGVVAVVFIIMGSVNYLTSEGDPGKVKKAHQTITFAIIGLLVVLIAAAITSFVTNAINSASIGILVGGF